VQRQIAAEEAAKVLRERDREIETLRRQVAGLEAVKNSLEGQVAKYDREVRRMRSAARPPAEDAEALLTRARGMVGELEAFVVASKQGAPAEAG
jgi:chromosome segregation ATPase